MHFVRLFAVSFILAGSLLPSAGVAYGQYVHPSDALVDSLRNFLEVERESQQIPGLTVAVIRYGEIVVRFDLGHADLEHGVFVGEDAVFEIGSLSKQFTATAVIMLREDGRLSLGDPVHRFLPELPSEWQGVSIRQLLTHTSGIPDYEEEMGYYAYRNRMTADRVIDFAHAIPVRFSPGAAYSYSNTGYYVLSRLVERLSESSLADFLQSRIFGPLEMNDTRLASAHEVVPGRVSGYARNQAGRLENRDALQVSATLGAGGILSTAADVAKWDRALYTDTILPQPVLAEMWSPGRLNNGQQIDYGMGWRVEPYDGHREQYHYGMMAGFVANMTRLSDDGVTIVVLGNRYEARVSPILVAVLHAVVPNLGPSGIEGAPR